MIVCQRKTFSLLLPLFFLVILCCGCFTVTVKNYPAKKPYVYATNIHIESDSLNGDEKKDLAAQLLQQLHDSVKVRTVSKAIGWDNAILGIVPRFFYEVLNNPNVYDSIHAEESKQFMRTLLNSLGYYRDSISYTTKISSKNDSDELRTQLDFFVYPRNATKLDSIAYNLNADTASISPLQKQNLDTIQQITLAAKPQALIKKSDPFSKYKLAGERDRLADLFRNNGYLRFSEEELLVLWDTVGVELLRPTIDPAEQIRLLQELASRRANPVTDIEFRLRENPDSTRTIRYYIGNVTVYPTYTIDTVKTYRNNDTLQGYTIRYNESLFKKKIFPDYIFLKPGDLYRQTDVLKTQGKFNALSAWRIVSIDQKPRPGQDTADFDIRLTPARKYAFNTNLEVSRNQGNLAIAQGNLIGLGVTAGVQNRNFARGANQSTTNFRFGTELNATLKDFIQTRQITLGHTIQIPRLVPKSLKILSKQKENTTASIFALNAGLTDRRDYFSLTSFTTSWGYQLGWRNHILGFRLPNIEYNYLVKKDSLEVLIQKNASYKYIFNTGLIISLPINFNITTGTDQYTMIKSFSLEFSGLPGLFRNAFATQLYRFGKFDGEIRTTIKKFRNAIALRGFFGIGFGLPFSGSDSANRYLPFFRQYFAGGPNSMRAWSVRKLGPGSAIRSFGRTDAPDRFGDVRFETNAEYRIYLTNYRGVLVNTAVYTDIGNVWFLRENKDFPGGEFPTSFSKLWKDLAIGLGTGLRIDFGFLKVRLDYAYKVKDPTPETLSAQNKWFYGWQLLGGQVQLGIDYPF